MSRLFIGGLPEDASRTELEHEFKHFGQLRDIWVARNPPGFGFVLFEDSRDAADALKEMNGTRVCGSRIRVEYARGGTSRGGRGGGRGGGMTGKCYSCGKFGHTSRQCRSYGGSIGGGRGRSRSRSPRRSRSRSYERRRRRSSTHSPGRDRERSHRNSGDRQLKGRRSDSRDRLPRRSRRSPSSDRRSDDNGTYRDRGSPSHSRSPSAHAHRENGHYGDSRPTNDRRESPD